MVLNDRWIREFGLSIITPFTPEQVNPASYDLTLDYTSIDLKDNREYLGGELNIFPGEAYLASTIEYVKMPYDVAGVLYLKSSLARQGLDHALAGWVDPGFEGNLTLELHSHRPITLISGQRVLQIVFYLMNEVAENPYSGRYKQQRGPTRAISELLSEKSRKNVKKWVYFREKDDFACWTDSYSCTTFEMVDKGSNIRNGD